MCRYPLLFAELLKYTPVDDCANSHMEVENTWIRLREATAEINRATDDTRMRNVLEKTWILQDRLVFANQVSPPFTTLSCPLHFFLQSVINTHMA